MTKKQPAKKETRYSFYKRNGYKITSFAAAEEIERLEEQKEQLLSTIDALTSIAGKNAGKLHFDDVANARIIADRIRREK